MWFGQVPVDRHKKCYKHATIQNYIARVLTVLYDSIFMELGSACPTESILILAKSSQCSRHTSMDRPP